MLDLASRIVTETLQLSTDGWNGFKNAVQGAFGFEVNYGQLIKSYAEGVQEGRYGPPSIIATERRQIIGAEDIDPYSICTSHVERNNLTIRTFMKRFTRLSPGFSKKLETLPLPSRCTSPITTSFGFMDHSTSRPPWPLALWTSCGRLRICMMQLRDS
jgi:hypothetical protein